MIHPINHLTQVIRVGVQTETGVEAIGFDLSSWLTRWPDLTYAVWVTRPGEQAAYPAAETEIIGNVLYWYPNATDTEKEGAGTVEIVGIGGGKCKTTGPVDTIVKKTSIDVTQETPEPIRPWAEKVMEAAAKVEADLAEISQKVPDILLVKMGAGNVSDHTQDDVKQAYFAGRAVLMVDPRGRVHTMSGLDNGTPVFYNTAAVKALDGNRNPDAILIYTARLNADGKFAVGSPSYNRTPNPYALTLNKGDAVTTYDGAEAVSIDIPDIPAPTGPNQELVTDADGNAVWAERATKTVILYPTDLVGIDDSGDGVNDMFSVASPWVQDMVVGGVYEVTYNGTAYECTAGDYHDFEPNAPEGIIVLGNLALTGGTGGNPDAPFIMLAYPNSQGAEAGTYGMLVPGDGATAVTLGITGTGAGVEVQEEIYTVNVEVAANTSNTLDFGACDKTWAEIAAAYAARKTLQVKLHQKQDGGEMVFPARIECELVTGGALTGLTVRYAVNMYANKDDVRWMVAADDGGVKFVDPS